MQNVNVSRVCPYDLRIRAQPHNAPARHLPDETDKSCYCSREQCPRGFLCDEQPAGSPGIGAFPLKQLVEDCERPFPHFCCRVLHFRVDDLEGARHREAQSACDDG
jgi:hypothetical protein